MEPTRPHTSGGERTRTLLVLAVLVLSTLPLGLSAVTSVPLFSTAAPEALEAEELEGRAPTDIELTPGVEAAFSRESYAPGSTATLRLFNRARGLRLQIFHVGPEKEPTAGNVTMKGVPVMAVRSVGSSAGRKTVSVRIGSWQTGVYFARLDAADGRVGFAPFVVRPRRLGQHRVAVVMPTLTWQAYNLRDMDGDGKGDS